MHIEGLTEAPPQKKMLFSKSVKTIGTFVAALVLMVSVSQATQFHIPAIDQAPDLNLPASATTNSNNDQAIVNRAEVSDSTLDEELTPAELANEFKDSVGLFLQSKHRRHRPPYDYREQSSKRRFPFSSTDERLSRWATHLYFSCFDRPRALRNSGVWKALHLVDSDR